LKVQITIFIEVIVDGRCIGWNNVINNIFGCTMHCKWIWYL